METTDKQFIFSFIGVIMVLVMITVFVLVVANWIGGSVEGGKISQAEIDRSNERIKPVGQVSLKSQPAKTVVENPTTVAKVADTAKGDSLAGEDTGKKIYDRICQACHATGVLNAPVFGNAQEWNKRLSSGREKLYNSALHGFGSMPAKGGNPGLSDQEVKAAVDYMVQASQ